MKRIIQLLMAGVFALLVPNGFTGGETVEKADLGRKVKLRILVDKVMQPTEGWVTREWMVKEAAGAGFNVFSPRRGHENLAEVRQVTSWCKRYDIFHMPWMRGTLTAPAGEKANGRRVVWPSGNEQPLWSPNSDEFWEWTSRYIIEYARMSKAQPHLIGVFLDYENYAKGKEGNLYSLSYDDAILKRFAQSMKTELPELEYSKRKKWLEQKGLHGEFSTFQIGHWQERCRKLREAVDEHNASFQFCIYPAPGTLFMVNACYPEWSTEEAPIILADASTYGRSSRLLPQSEALRTNRGRLLARKDVPKKAGIPFIYAGGIDPAVRGADPEFCGKNAVMISDITDGYWVFYEGPKYDETHPEYWKWFTWANKAIVSGNFKSQHEPRVNPENWAVDVFGAIEGPLRLTAPQPAGTVDFPTVKLRRDNMLVIAARAGQKVEVVLQNVPIAKYVSLLAWDLRDSKNKLASGTIPHGDKGKVEFTAGNDGVYLLGVSAGTCAYSVVSSNVSLGLFAGEKLSMIYGAKRLFFYVPEGIEQFELVAMGSGAETVRINVYDQEGQLSASAQTSARQSSIRLKVPVKRNAGKTWSLELTRADEGVLEDCSIILDKKLAPVLSLLPDQVFKTNK